MLMLPARYAAEGCQHFDELSPRARRCRSRYAAAAAATQSHARYRPRAAEVPADASARYARARCAAPQLTTRCSADAAREKDDIET